MPTEPIPIWEWCWVAFAAISACMHIMVMVTIVRARQRNSANILKAPFFTIIFIEGIHELLELCTTTGFNRLRKYQIIPYAIKEDYKLVEYQWYWFCHLKSVLYLGHIETALNRLSAVVLFMKFDKLWNTKNIIYMNLIGYAILAGARTILYRIYLPDLKVTTFLNNATGQFSVKMEPDAFAVESGSDIVLSLVTGIICIVCYSAAAIRHKQQGYLNLHTKKQEATLLKIGIVTFLILLPTTIRSGIDLWSYLTDHDALRSFIQRWNMIPAEAMCMAQPWLLLIFCRSLRETMFSSSTRLSAAVTSSGSNPVN